MQNMHVDNNMFFIILILCMSIGQDTNHDQKQLLIANKVVSNFRNPKKY